MASPSAPWPGTDVLGARGAGLEVAELRVGQVGHGGSGGAGDRGPGRGPASAPREWPGHPGRDGAWPHESARPRAAAWRSAPVRPRGWRPAGGERRRRRGKRSGRRPTGGPADDGSSRSSSSASVALARAGRRRLTSCRRVQDASHCLGQANVPKLPRLSAKLASGGRPPRMSPVLPDGDRPARAWPQARLAILAPHGLPPALRWPTSTPSSPSCEPSTRRTAIPWKEVAARETLEALLRDSGCGRAFLIEEDGRLVGLSRGLPSATAWSSTAGTPSSTSSTSCPLARARGLGTQALRVAEDCCREAGARALHLEVGHTTTARAALPLLGVRRTAVRYLMSKPLR